MDARRGSVGDVWRMALASTLVYAACGDQLPRSASSAAAPQVATTTSTIRPTGTRPPLPNGFRGSHMMTAHELYRLGRMRVSGTVPDEDRESLPIPVRHGGSLYVLFLFFPSINRPGQPSQLGAPAYVATLRAADGHLESLQSLGASGGGTIGSFGLPEGMTAPEYLERQQELFAAYDVLLPAFERGDTDLGASGREWAAYGRQLFDIVSEPPLRPYYAQYGAEFFAWLARIGGH